MMPRSKRTSANRGSGRGKAIASRPFWMCPTTGRTSDTKDGDDWEYWHSRLEYKIWIQAQLAQKPLMRQHPLELLPRTATLKPVIWNVDFYDPLENLLIEAKGPWINEPAHKDHKATFLLQCRLAIHMGHQLILLGNEPFKIGELDVIAYPEFFIQ